MEKYNNRHGKEDRNQVKITYFEQETRYELIGNSQVVIEIKEAARQISEDHLSCGGF